jgi:sigma54-dependent transcription regulator
LVASAGGGTVLLDEVGLVGADTIETRDPDR